MVDHEHRDINGIKQLLKISYMKLLLFPCLALPFEIIKVFFFQNMSNHHFDRKIVVLNATQVLLSELM